MRNRCYVLNHSNLKTCGCKCADCRLSACSGTSYENLNSLHTLINCELTCVPSAVTAAWDCYGDVAWYVEGYRKKFPLCFTFGAIDGKSLKWYTQLSDLLPALESVFLSHNWLVTDVS